MRAMSIFTTGLFALSSTAVAAGTARDLVLRALAAQGGRDQLAGIHRVRFQETGYHNMVEQSEWPEGPYVVAFQKITEVHDPESRRFRRSISEHVANFPEFTDAFFFADGIAVREAAGSRAAGSSALAGEAQEILALSPERLLLTALAAVDVKDEGQTKLHAVPHRVISFSFNGAPVRIFLNANTMLPSAVESSGAAAHSGFWNYLGDVTMRITWSFWSLSSNGIRYPLQWDIERNGLPDRMFFIDSLDFNPPDDFDWSISAELRKQFEKSAGAANLEELPLGLPGQPAQEIAPGIIFIPGRWNVSIVRQDDGVVILEAPISSGYSAKVMEEARRRFPQLPVKAVIATSDSWPHLAGIREYVARGVPIYALDLNRPILERVIADPRRSKPDALSRTPRPPKLMLVSGRTQIGAGPNRMEIYPLRGQTTERQMMVYFPGRELLYGSDAFQKSGNEYFSPQTVSQVVDAVKRERLAVREFFMMHMDPSPWSELPR